MDIVLNLNKSGDMTSRDAVTAAKRLFKIRKAGHAGTLDPIATGVLLVCFNEATKITGYLSDMDKEYVVTAKLGEATDTYDTEGVITRKADVPDFTRQDLETALQGFTGKVEQTPPMYSAIKMNGRPLYELARKGIEIERRPRVVTIHAIEILGMKLPYIEMRVACSKGTYIRSLCNDLGNALGVGAHVYELARTRIGCFTLESAAALSELPNKTQAMHTIDSALKHLGEIVLTGAEYARAMNGNPVSIVNEVQLTGGSRERPSPFVRLKNPEGNVFGIGKVVLDSIKIERLFRI